MEYEITELSHLQNFLLGGKAMFTLRNEKSGNHIVFSFRKQDVKYKHIFPIKLTPTQYIYVHKHSKIYLGYFQCKLDVDPPITWIHPNSKLYEDEMVYYRIIMNFLMMVFSIGKMPKGLKIYYNGKCSICGRKLTDPDYIKIGIGKYCLENGSK